MCGIASQRGLQVGRSGQCRASTCQQRSFTVGSVLATSVCFGSACERFLGVSICPCRIEMPVRHSRLWVHLGCTSLLLKPFPRQTLALACAAKIIRIPASPTKPCCLLCANCMLLAKFLRRWETLQSSAPRRSFKRLMWFDGNVNPLSDVEVSPA